MDITNLLLLSGWCEVCGTLGWWEWSFVDPASPGLYLLCANHHKDKSNSFRNFLRENRKSTSYPGCPVARLIGGFFVMLLCLLLFLYLFTSSART